MAGEKKNRGPIRTEVVYPLLAVVIIFVLYFTFLFDHHLKKVLEYVGYEVIGAEVDIGSLETHFTKASIRIQNIEVTNPTKPSHNMLALGDLRFALSWDGLLRAKAIVDEIAIEGVAIDVERKKPGKVKPPDPPKPSVVGEQLNQFKRESLLEIEKDNQGNALSDIASLLGGGSMQDQIKHLQSQLSSEGRIKDAQILLDQKSKEWQEKLKSLPNADQLNQLGKDIGEIKMDFSNPAEILQNVQKAQKVIQTADAYIKSTQTVSSSVNTDFQTLQKSVQDLEKSVKSDVSQIEQKLKIPHIDPKSLTQALVMSYVNRHLAKLSYYKNLAQKYLPPKFTKKKNVSEKSAETAENIQPHPRAKGVTYEFGRQFSYPLFWIKRISLSSSADPTTKLGAFQGRIENVTSNQYFIQKPTTAHLEGSFPKDRIEGFRMDGTFDDLKGSPLIEFDTSIGSYPIEHAVLLDSPDVGVDLASARGSLTIAGNCRDFETAEVNINNQFASSAFSVQAKNDVVQNILTGTFEKLKDSYIHAHLWGELPILSSALDSNIGQTLSVAFSAQIQKQVDHLRKQIEDQVQGAIKGQKETLEKSIGQVKLQVDQQIKKVTDQVEGQKKRAEADAKGSQKDDLLNNLKKGFGF